MIRNVAHEGHHHLQDVQRLLAVIGDVDYILPMWKGRTPVLRPAKSSPLAFSRDSIVQMPSVSACVAGVQFSTICA